MNIEAYAERFAEAGFATLLFDFRYFGASGGEPRGQLFPHEQHEDYRNALTWLGLREDVDEERLGLWGTSFAGGQYDPASFAPRLSPTPLLMIVALGDELTPADLALDAFASAREPKRLELLDSNHFAVYSDADVMARAADAAVDFFREHLAVGRPLATATSVG